MHAHGFNDARCKACVRACTWNSTVTQKTPGAIRLWTGMTTHLSKRSEAAEGLGRRAPRAPQYRYPAIMRQLLKLAAALTALTALAALACVPGAASFVSPPRPPPSSCAPAAPLCPRHGRAAPGQLRTPAHASATRGQRRRGDEQPLEGDRAILQKDAEHAHTRVIIVGGGIGGLAAALALARRGFRVKVLEKDASFAARRQVGHARPARGEQCGRESSAAAHALTKLPRSTCGGT